MQNYRNAAHAFIHKLQSVAVEAQAVQVRGSRTLELTAQGFTIDRPLERCITVHHRRNSIAATIAETMWMLAGRSDVDWLARYLPRAMDYSDDGLTWRAAYGPRLRAWNGVDQLMSVRDALLEEKATRRAVAVLFDPARDHQPSRDVPCANLLHFLVREDRLDLMITARSNDLVWGFSGINAFEWSVLHELMATWVGVAVGRQHYFISSLHVYDEHTERSSKMLQTWPGTTAYEEGAQRAAYAGTWSDLPAHLDAWFVVEALVRRDPLGAAEAVDSFPEPMMRSFLSVIRAYWLLEAGEGPKFAEAARALGGTDLGDALAEWGSRRGACAWSPPTPSAPLDLPVLASAVASLHRAKSAVYGDSWKRRGEVLGIVANVARKVDRLEALEAGAAAGEEESAFDTLVDLFVYLVKYQTWLADNDAAVRAHLFGAEETLRTSEGVEFFEVLLERFARAQPAGGASIRDLVERFKTLEVLVAEGYGSAQVFARFEEVQAMATDCLAVISRWAQEHPLQARRYIEQALSF